MSPRAAARLEAMGFTLVYDYVGGKKDWLAAGLPVEGERANEQRSGDLARRDPPRCRPGGSAQSVDEIGLESWGLCVVAGDDGVVHGLVTPAVELASENSRVDEIMQLGPTTIRPRRSIESALKQMDQLEVDFILVTTELGELLGVLYREEAQAHLERH
jgi:hypothetical protein